MAKKSSLTHLGIRQVASAAGVVEYTLKANGLQILLKEDATTPAVTFMVVYKCGSRNEGAGTTGSAHFFEHLMFKGTKAFDPLEGNGPMDIFGRIGAELNANTSYDRTRYFEVVPAQHLELCARVEADRMRGLKNRSADRDSEMTVVRNEMERGENNPGSALFKEVMAAAFKEHPYHSSVIGSRSDVEGVPMAKMVEFYDDYYWPNNATVIVTGGFQTEEALRVIAKYFGRIPRSPKPIPAMYTVEPLQEGERRIELRRAGSLPQLFTAYHTPASTHPDTYALSALGHILGDHGQPASRLYKALVETSMVNSCGASNFELKDPGVFYISAALTAKTELDAVEAAINTAILELQTNPVTDAELDRVKAANRKGTIKANDDPKSFCNLLSNAVGLDSWQWNISYDDNYDKVTPADILRVAQTYLKAENRTVGRFVPTKGGPAVKKEAEENKPRSSKPRKQKRTKLAPFVGKTDFASRVERTVLPNGLTVSVMRRGNGAVAVNTATAAGSFFAPKGNSAVASITADLLVAGSAKFDKQRIGELTGAMAARLNFGSDQYSVDSGALLAVEDFPAYIELLADVLANPVFAEAELAKKLPAYRANIARQKEATDTQGNIGMMRAAYPEGHPFHWSTTDESLSQVEQLTSDALRAFHAEHYSPKSTVITVVGDVDPAEAIKVIEAHFGSWTGPERKSVSIPAVDAAVVAAAAAEHTIKVTLPDKKSVDLYIGKATSLSRKGEDYYAARIANMILGKSTIADRLGKVVRVQHGLTYGIRSAFGDTTHGGAPWYITVSVAPENVTKALGLIKGVVDEFVADGITDEELEDKVSQSIGGVIVGLRSSAGISGSLCSVEFDGFGAKGLDDIIDGWRSVTKEQVRASIAKYLTLDNTFTVLAGTLSE